jgi:flap endonuclease GEN
LTHPISNCNNTQPTVLETSPVETTTIRSQFWSESERCASLLLLLGVTVLQAEAEGEALSALLNARRICDGDVSDDGGCFLFGAKTLYTKFAVENLENHQVMRK